MILEAQESVNPPWLNENEYPFHGHFYECKAGFMHYLDEGFGSPVVFLHGNPAWSFSYRNVIKAVSGQYRCIAPDLIGFGLSDKPAAWDYTPEQHAENIEELLNFLQLTNIILVVNDWGGPIGLSYAEKYPGKIRKLIILNTWMWPVNNDWYYKLFSGFMGGLIGRTLIKKYNFFARVILKQAFGDRKKLTKEIHSHYLMPLDNPEDRKGCYVFPKQIIDSGNWLFMLWERHFRINSIHTTFIWGMKDIAFRERELEFWIANWKNLKVIKLEDVGHFPQEEAPEVIINELLNK